MLYTDSANTLIHLGRYSLIDWMVWGGTVTKRLDGWGGTVSNRLDGLGRYSLIYWMIGEVQWLKLSG